MGVVTSIASSMARASSAASTGVFPLRTEYRGPFTELAGFDCQFDVADFHLYRHGVDSVWRPVADFALTGT